MESDYVIVGAGSAGCALAYRLAEAGKSVILIEFGGSDLGPFIQMPAALSYPMNMPLYDWGFQSEPEPNLGNRRLATPRGKVVGGSSSINGMIFVRGNAQDYEHWAESGAKGWSYRDVLPYFKRMETWHGGTSEYRGKNGPLHVTRGPGNNPLTKAFRKAGVQAGYDDTEDYNGHQQEGFGPYDMTVYKGRRWSTANAYLRPAKDMGVKVVRGLAQRVIIKDKVATGVEILQGGQTQIISARSEVILSASAINSPKLLMLSGIGPAEHLREHGIEVVADRAGVGKNLQDHLELYVQYNATKPVSLYKYWSLLGKAYVGARWLFTKTGIGASNQFEMAGFIRSKSGVKYPDIQFHFLPIAVRYDGKTAASGHGFQAHVGPMRSVSRGEITLKSNNPTQAPRIFFNYMSDPSDWEDFRTCIRHTREIIGQNAFDQFRGDEIQPGAMAQSDAALDDVIREHAESAFHPCGTCRMGAADDATPVVDPEARVIGVSGLRVADSSIFPRITNGNLNAPSIMTGEKVADHILGRSLPPEDLQAWQHPDWESKQR
ncbi:choline dehydrogenase [Aestuariibius sp. HNIBRBA575]|uniref:choline dehydrogenase n=1 Tax=Aestuariibius sp. HNIBRBA575 TaxID=3233343 RepID=UPI0034A5B738